MINATEERAYKYLIHHFGTLPENVRVPRLKKQQQYVQFVHEHIFNTTPLQYILYIVH
jgi:hypothetical protein